MPNVREWRNASIAWRGAIAVGAAVLLAACGSSGNGPTPLTVPGVVADGPIGGTVVFLDLNGNFILDEGEPVSSPTEANGSFSVPVPRLTAAQLTTAAFVTHVPTTAQDADDGGRTLGDAGRRPFSMAAPAIAFIGMGADGNVLAAPVFISPLTTFVADEISRNGLTLEQAKAAVRSQLALASDPMANFLAAGDSGLRTWARQLADAFGRLAQDLAALAETGDIAGHPLKYVPETIKRNPGLYVTGLSPTPQAGVQAVDGVSVAPTTQVPRVLAPMALVPQGFADFILVFRRGTGPASTGAAEAATVSHGGQVKHVFRHALDGLSVRLPLATAAAFIDAMARSADVLSVEDDLQAKTASTQLDATWGLDRADQNELPLNASYSYTTTGAGVRAFVVDTGILATHTDFGARVAAGYSVVADGRGTTDCNGHGTHVSATLGGSSWGIAKGVTLVPVRVFDCTGSGFVSDVIAGLDWIAQNGQRPAVVNMSLSAGKSSALDLAAGRLVEAGFTVVAAAGNANANACNYSPAGLPAVITVGATTDSDARAAYSNYGLCLDLFAPGDLVTSAWFAGDTAIATMSGTSMAAPHVSGLSALILEALPAATPSEVANAILTTATSGTVTNIDESSANKILYTLGTAQNPPPPPPAPPRVLVSITNLTGSAASLRSSWRATAIASVSDANGNPVGGATVTGDYTAGGSSLTCTTGSNGTCSIMSAHIPVSHALTTFSVVGIAGTGLDYDAGANTSSSIVIPKPRGNKGSSASR